MDCPGRDHSPMGTNNKSYIHANDCILWQCFSFSLFLKSSWNNVVFGLWNLFSSRPGTDFGSLAGPRFST